MLEKINPVRYPTLFRYLSSLPQGLASYPNIASQAEMAQAPRACFEDELKREDLPDDVKAMLLTPWVKGTWIPEVHFMTSMALIRDIVHKNDEKYLQYIFDVMKQQFSRPIMRPFMYVVSPSVLGLATEKKWNTYKRGVPMKTLKTSENGRTLSITYPPKLYVPCMLEGMAKSIEAGISCTRTKTYSVKAEIISDVECHFVASYEF